MGGEESTTAVGGTYFPAVGPQGLPPPHNRDEVAQRECEQERDNTDRNKMEARLRGESRSGGRPNSWLLFCWPGKHWEHHWNARWGEKRTNLPHKPNVAFASKDCFTSESVVSRDKGPGRKFIFPAI